MLKRMIEIILTTKGLTMLFLIIIHEQIHINYLTIRNN